MNNYYSSGYCGRLYQTFVPTDIDDYLYKIEKDGFIKTEPILYNVEKNIIIDDKLTEYLDNTQSLCSGISLCQYISMKEVNIYKYVNSVFLKLKFHFKGSAIIEAYAKNMLLHHEEYSIFRKGHTNYFVLDKSCLEKHQMAIHNTEILTFRYRLYDEDNCLLDKGAESFHIQ